MDVHAVAVHPGAVRGNLLRFIPAPWFVVRAFERLFYWDAATAALDVLRPLVDDEIEPGSYLVPVARPHVSSDRAADAELGVRLWSASEVLVADIRHANRNYSLAVCRTLTYEARAHLEQPDVEAQATL